MNRLVAPILVLIPLLAGLAAAQRSTPVAAWRTDLDRARTEAQAGGRLLLVAVHELGEAGSEALTDAWGHGRLAKALGKDALPVLVCVGEGAITPAVRKLLAGAETDAIRRDAMAAVRALFGPGAMVTTPQAMVLHPDYGVLWHQLRPAGLACVLRGLETARRDARRSASDHLTRLRERAGRLARLAERDPLAFEEINALVRNVHTAHFAGVFETVARHRGLAERILGGAFAAQPVTRREALLRQVEGHEACRSFLALAREREAEAGRVCAAPVREIAGPLPEVRAAGTLDGVRFTDGKARSMAECRGRPTVLLFLRHDVADLTVQLASLLPVIAELTGEGVQCLALFASAEPDAHLPAVEALGLPCPAGVYRFTSGQPAWGVGYFPAALVLDDAGRVVLADDGPGHREYAGFAPTARGLARHLRQRPRLTGASG